MSEGEQRKPPADEPEQDDWDDWDELDEEGESFPRMSFLEHLDELRGRIFRIVLILLLSVMLGWFFVDTVWSILEGPARRMLANAQEKSLSLTREAQDLSIELERLPRLPEELRGHPDFERFRTYFNRHLDDLGGDLERQVRDILVAKDSKLMQTAVGEAFFLKVKVAFLTGLVFCSPLLFYQLWAFVAPGLYRRERSIAIPFVVFSTLFFTGGIVFGYYIAVPFAGTFLMSFGTEFVQLITINKYMDFLITMMLGLGIVFEIPMVIFLLAKIGIATPRWLIRNFRYAVLVIVIVAAVVTPTGDPVNLALFSTPMVLLYCLGIGVAAVWGPKGKGRWEEDLADDDEDFGDEEEDEDDSGEEEGDDDDNSSGGPEAPQGGEDEAAPADPHAGEIYDESQPYPKEPDNDQKV